VLRMFNRLRFRWHLIEKDTRVFVAGFVVILGGLIMLSITMGGDADGTKEKRCLALNIYHEARGESEAGQVAVATVALNRVAHKRYPDTLCDVIYEYNWNPRLKAHIDQFSWTHDKHTNAPGDEKAWSLALKIAEKVMKDGGDQTLHGVLHYHASTVNPGWANKLQRVKTIGQHQFYR